MPDDPKTTGPLDSRKVNIHEDHEVKYWTKEFGVSKEELKMAVMEVGTSAEAVKKYFKNSQTPH